MERKEGSKMKSGIQEEEEAREEESASLSCRRRSPEVNQTIDRSACGRIDAVVAERRVRAARDKEEEEEVEEKRLPRVRRAGWNACVPSGRKTRRRAQPRRRDGRILTIIVG